MKNLIRKVNTYPIRKTGRKEKVKVTCGCKAREPFSCWGPQKKTPRGESCKLATSNKLKKTGKDS